ncbi:MAG TPA: hydrogenase maturation nickel metallochaperone HypA, partial [Gammaproteobacteria bacterium]|nr:hydrogenase maturation nickel metallochaperone HypA [Gammaproteobacteria bacterium]
MHELSVCQALIDQLRGIATGHRAHRIARVRLVLGPLSGVEPDLLQRAWPLASAGGIAA